VKQRSCATVRWVCVRLSSSVIVVVDRLGDGDSETILCAVLK
jgi:hypothetical protein